MVHPNKIKARIKNVPLKTAARRPDGRITFTAEKAEYVGRVFTFTRAVDLRNDRPHEYFYTTPTIHEGWYDITWLELLDAPKLQREVPKPDKSQLTFDFNTNRT